jgi:formate hydrogenlyase subunit 3/multisubunit Na+/H+ antiporter MnhD subunit
MVGPIYIIAVALGVAFLMGLLKRLGNTVAGGLMLASLGFMTFVSLQWLFGFLGGQIENAVINTSGFKPPFSIQLLMGKYEAFFTSMVNVVGLLGGIYMWDKLKQQGLNAFIIYLVMFMGLNVVIMTQDIFNLFVFLEVSTIAIVGLIVLQRDIKAISAGFKYLIASALISGLMLIGVIFIYRYAGSLYIQDIIAAGLPAFKGGIVAVFLLFISIALELKPFPANGWALDVYEGAHPGLAALLSAAFASAMAFVLYKVLPFAGAEYQMMFAYIGAFTFLGSNLLGIKQDKARRLLGYSSVGQIGLVIAIIGLEPLIGDKMVWIAFGILITHYMAKAGLFWLAGIVKNENIRDWSALRKKPWLLLIFGTFAFALVGMPPFPSFFAKWQLVMELSAQNAFSWIAIILLGSFFEGVYLFRWVGYAFKLEHSHLEDFQMPLHKAVPMFIMFLGLFIAGYFTTFIANAEGLINFIPLAFIAVIYLLDVLPAKVKNILAIAGLAYYSYMIMPELYETDGLRFVFAVIFLIGGILTLIAGFTFKGQRKGFYPAALLMYAGLGELIMAQTTLQFFFAWEIMTIGSYILIIRGKRSMPHGLSYMLFSIGGAYLMLAGFGITFANTGVIQLDSLAHIVTYATWAYAFIAIGFLTKTAALGVHMWLPGAHAEAESDVSPMVSAILLKAGVFGLLILFLAMGAEKAGDNVLVYILGWLGAITVLVGNLKAVFQEDAKRLLAYSSIGQLGYILFAFAIMTHLGWVTGFIYTINHFLFKAALFLTIGGIVLRVKTHMMYEMGGLIKRMPFSFIAVLIGIITLAGIPPLSGFAGKWMFYSAIIEKGWYLQGGIIFFGGIIAFLYAFRLIYAVFLGPLKDKHIHVKEISGWFLVPIYVLLAGIMVFSAKPQWVMQPIGNFLKPYFPTDVLQWSADGTAITPLGYWNGSLMMIIVLILFALVIGGLLILNRNAKKVKQFNIVYAGERPERPETTHMAHNMFAGYNKAMGIFIIPWISETWYWLADAMHALADKTRRIYSGNGQAYVLHVLMYVVVVYLIIIGGTL